MTTPDWEQVFNKRAICPTCSEDVTFDKCDCRIDIPDFDAMDDSYDQWG